MIFATICLIILTLLMMICNVKCKLFRWIQMKLRKTLFFNFILRLLIESYLELSICSLINVTDVSPSEIINIGSLRDFRREIVILAQLFLHPHRFSSSLHRFCLTEEAQTPPRFQELRRYVWYISWRPEEKQFLCARCGPLHAFTSAYLHSVADVSGLQPRPVVDGCDDARADHLDAFDPLLDLWI